MGNIGSMMAMEVSLRAPNDCWDFPAMAVLPKPNGMVRIGETKKREIHHVYICLSSGPSHGFLSSSNGPLNFRYFR